MSNVNFKTAAKNTAVEGRTHNGMKTLTSSLDPVVDLFFLAGASRGKDITAQFERAYQADRVLALKVAAWARDVRGGAGERQLFRDILRYIERNHPQELPMVINIGPAFGRWDDILVLETPLGKKLAYDLIKENLLVAQDGLCAKWMPRKGPDAVALTKHLGLTPKGYRKLLVGLTKVVETAMCSGDWSKINYSHVPSVAAARYQKAFWRHDADGYKSYVEALKKNDGSAKVNANAVYPYDVIKSLRMGGDKDVVTAQWAALPNYVGDEKILPLVDVSGSMGCAVGGNPNLTCMDVALSLGLYLADKNEGAFKDMFVTFSANPKIEVLTGDIVSKLHQLQRADWGMNTDLIKAFDLILAVATKHKVQKADMPAYLLILSDMEFDRCAKADDSALEAVNRRYEAAGYTRPNIVFWNLNGRVGNVPVKYDENGTALVSGFSPAIMKGILAAEEMTPVSVMLSVLNNPRYSVIK